MNQYLGLVKHILNNGHDVPDRTGTGTRAVFGYQMRFDLNEGFPLVTSKQTFWHGAFVEMLWFLRGDTNTDWLQAHGVHIWSEWASREGSLGPIYGQQWREWCGPGYDSFDQLDDLINGLRDDPHSRRHVMSAWAVHELPLPGRSPQFNADIGRMALAPCHCLVQFHVDANNRLHCQLYQRSADVFLGIPFNIAGYALLTHLLAHRLGYKVGEFIHTLGDAHLYSNHFEQARELLQREPRPLPTLVMAHSPETPVDKVEPRHLSVAHYVPHPAIKAEVSV